MKKTSKTKRARPAWLPPRLWFVAVAVVVAAAAFAAWRQAFAGAFRLAAGPSQVNVVRGMGQVVTYTLAYEGWQPATLNGVLLVVTGETLYVDFKSVWLSTQAGEREVQVPPDGKLTGEPLRLQPGDRLYAMVELLGTSRGANGVRGFRLTFRELGLTSTQELRFPKDYVILVN